MLRPPVAVSTIVDHSVGPKLPSLQRTVWPLCRVIIGRSDATDQSMTKTSDTPKMNVAVYARVSTDKQDNGNQLGQLREFAARQGWAISHRFRQEGSAPV
jgi:predicted site-specific integrase-resolvase